MEVCSICKQEFKTRGSLHSHLKKSEKTTQEAYYHKFFPRFDINSGKILPYKDYKDYSARLFTDKRSEFSYILSEGFKDEAKNILISQLETILTKRDRFPLYTEWRSSKNVRYDWLEREDIFKELLAYKPDIRKFRYDDPEKLENLDHPILIDTREQKPFFDGERSTVNVGDYCFGGQNYNGINIDRKSKADFIGTFGPAGVERFMRECEKAKALGVTLVVLIEEDYQSCWSFRPANYSKSKIGGEHAFAGARQISRIYDVQFVFAKDLVHAKTLVRTILSNPELVRGWDLQFLLEKGVI